MVDKRGGSNIPIEALRSFVAICDLGSFTKAGIAMGLTQPAISAQIKKLQRVIGCEVFDKSLPGVHLTEQGAALLKIARRMAALHDQALSVAGTTSRSSSLRVAIPTVYAAHILGNVLQIKPPPGYAGIQIVCESVRDLVKLLEEGSVDVAFMVEVKPSFDAAIARWTEKWVWVGAPGFVLTPGEPIPLIRTHRAVSHRAAIEAIAASGRPYVYRFTAPDISVRLAAVRAGLGVMPLPERLLTPDLAVVRDGLPPLPDIVASVHVREGLENAGVLALAHQLANIVKPHRGRAATRDQQTSRTGTGS